MTSSDDVVARSSTLSRPRISDSVPIGRITSDLLPTSVPKKSGGITPTIVNGTRSIVCVLPMTSAEPPNRRCQKA